MFDAAWSALERHGGGSDLQEEPAGASKMSHPGKALAVDIKRVEEHVQFGRYEDAVRQIKRRARLRPAAERAAYVANLKQWYKRKHKFMKLLSRWP